MPLPDFLVIGAPKAGTTALHAALREHPGLYLPPVKEPKFFLTDGPPPDRGGPGDQQTYREHVWRRADYEALFAAAPPGAARGEATPFYLYDLDAQRRIHAAIPHARLIAILRDPVERAHSNWTHLWSAGLEPIGDVVRACAAEERRVADGWAHFWHYVRLGRYGEQLAHLFTLFPREQVLVFRYRDLVDRPAAHAGPHLRLPRRGAGPADRGAEGERDRAPGRGRQAPAALRGPAGAGPHRPRAPLRAGAGADGAGGAPAATAVRRPPPADLGAAAAAHPALRRRHRAAAARHRRGLRRLGAAQGAFGRAGRRAAGRPAPGPQRPPGDRLIMGRCHAGQRRSSVRSSCAPSERVYS
ncbi:sulfotransferase family protein [Nonomuraea ferruginea]